MPYITKTMNDGDLNIALQNFNAVCIANATGLGLTAPQLLEINGATSGFSDALVDLAAAKSNAEAKREGKDAQRTYSRSIISKWAKTFRANGAIPNSILADLQLAPHQTPSVKTPPTIPANLVANVDGLGNVKLEWKRNGNISGTTFVIESRTSASDPWIQVGTSTKRTFETVSTPGSYVAYRVKAVRRAISSSYCTPAILWDGTSESELRLAA